MATKSYPLATGGYYPLGMIGSQTSDLPMSKAGAAASYMLVPEVHNCIASITGGVTLLPWDIKRYPTGIRRGVEGQVIQR